MVVEFTAENARKLFDDLDFMIFQQIKNILLIQNTVELNNDTEFYLEDSETIIKRIFLDETSQPQVSGTNKYGREFIDDIASLHILDSIHILGLLEESLVVK